VRKANATISRSNVVTKAMPMEVAQIAGEAGFIAGVAGTMWAITLVVRDRPHYNISEFVLVLI